MQSLRHNNIWQVIFQNEHWHNKNPWKLEEHLWDISRRLCHPKSLEIHQVQLCYLAYNVHQIINAWNPDLTATACIHAYTHTYTHTLHKRQILKIALSGPILRKRNISLNFSKCAYTPTHKSDTVLWNYASCHSLPLYYAQRSVGAHEMQDFNKPILNFNIFPPLATYPLVI